MVTALPDADETVTLIHQTASSKAHGWGVRLEGTGAGRVNVTL